MSEIKQLKKENKKLKRLIEGTKEYKGLKELNKEYLKEITRLYQFKADVINAIKEYEKSELEDINGQLTNI